MWSTVIYSMLFIAQIHVGQSVKKMHSMCFFFHSHSSIMLNYLNCHMRSVCLDLQVEAVGQPCMQP